jgi:predicted amidohydrolase YtcJ
MVVEHVRLFDSELATIREDQTVVIEGERITMAGPFAAASVPKDAEIIDGTGKTLVPGLFDMHAHAQAGDGILNIASGVATVRDMGNDIDEHRHLQDQRESGTAIGPRTLQGTRFRRNMNDMASSSIAGEPISG